MNAPELADTELDANEVLIAMQLIDLGIKGLGAVAFQNNNGMIVQSTLNKLELRGRLLAEAAQREADEKARPVQKVKDNNGKKK